MNKIRLCKKCHTEIIMSFNYCRNCGVYLKSDSFYTKNIYPYIIINITLLLISMVLLIFINDFLGILLFYINFIYLINLRKYYITNRF